MAASAKYLLAFLLFLSPTAIDVGLVTFVKGLVTNTRTKLRLKVGDRIFSTDKLLFTPNSSISYRIPRKGAFVMEANKITKVGGKIIAAVNQAKPATKYNLAGKKDGGVYNTLENYTEFFTGEINKSTEGSTPQTRLIIGEGNFYIATPEFEQSDKAFFYLSFIYPNQSKPVLKKLPARGNQLLLDPEMIGGIDGEPIDWEQVSNMKLAFLNTETRASTNICPVDLRFVSEEEALAQIGVLVEVMDGQASQEILNAVLEHFYNSYQAMPDNAHVKDILLEKHGIKME